MPILDIVTIENNAEMLATKTEDLSKAQILSGETQTFIEEMKDVCYTAGGLGLAANQLGRPISICIYATDPGRNTMVHQYSVLINPHIKVQKDRMISKDEGCLSVPGRRFNVKRWKKITVEGLDEHGNPVTITTKSKNLAKIIQHEIDHLNGITIADKGKERK